MNIAGCSWLLTANSLLHLSILSKYTFNSPASKVFLHQPLIGNFLLLSNCWFLLLLCFSSPWHLTPILSIVSLCYLWIYYMWFYPSTITVKKNQKKYCWHLPYSCVSRNKTSGIQLQGQVSKPGEGTSTRLYR
jgi:hypothetical protein